MELKTKSISFSSSQWFFAYMHESSMCSSFEAFLHVLWVWTCSVVRSASSSSRQFSPPLPSLFPLFIQCDGCLSPFPVWGLMAGLPGFASHGRSLHIGAGYQQWKLLDVSGTQPPLSDAVVKQRNSSSNQMRFPLFSSSSAQSIYDRVMCTLLFL